MRQSVNFYDFDNAFQSIRPDNFSYEGRRALFDYFEQYEEDCDTEVELDVIAICCDFSEDSPESIASSYSIDTSESEDEDEFRQIVIDYLNYNTQCIEIEGSDNLIYQVF